METLRYFTWRKTIVGPDRSKAFETTKHHIKIDTFELYTF